MHKVDIFCSQLKSEKWRGGVGGGEGEGDGGMCVPACVHTCWRACVQKFVCMCVCVCVCVCVRKLLDSLGIPFYCLPLHRFSPLQVT